MCAATPTMTLCLVMYVARLWGIDNLDSSIYCQLALPGLRLWPLKSRREPSPLRVFVCSLVHRKANQRRRKPFSGQIRNGVNSAWNRCSPRPPTVTPGRKRRRRPTAERCGGSPKSLHSASHFNCTSTAVVGPCRGVPGERMGNVSFTAFADTWWWREWLDVIVVLQLERAGLLVAMLESDCQHHRRE